MVGHLPSICDALGLTLSTTKTTLGGGREVGKSSITVEIFVNIFQKIIDQAEQKLQGYRSFEQYNEEIWSYNLYSYSQQKKKFFSSPCIQCEK